MYSLSRRENGTNKEKKLLSSLPVDLPDNYLDSVNEIIKKDVLEPIRNSVNKGKPFGKDEWIDKMVDDYDLRHTIRERGRPRKN